LSGVKLSLLIQNRHHKNPEPPPPNKLILLVVHGKLSIIYFVYVFNPFMPFDAGSRPVHDIKKHPLELWPMEFLIGFEFYLP
jgi:hypothetical protein